MWFVYILRCAGNSLYIGETDNLQARLTRHSKGTASIFTASRRPVELVYTESHSGQLPALRLERQLKRWTRAKKEALIAGDVARLKAL